MKPPRTTFVLSLLGLSFFSACTTSQPGSGAPQTSNASSANSNGQQGAGSTTSPSKNSNEPPAAKMAPTGTGSIEITSTPAGARVLLVSVDEGGAGEPQPRGVTPTTITGVYPGKYTVHLEKPGYRYYQKNVEVKANAAARVTATLRKQ